MKNKAKYLDKRAAQLDGALALVGGTNDVANYDNAEFTRRAGEVIARTAAHAEARTPEPKAKRADRS